ncbi:hypothetical protein B0O99DRAFT_673257 [Bisporella sp. PMI_857]|nr:hypothetical protein B0O99DRAFT_673257 [Bisporella sp. PMI_857]
MAATFSSKAEVRKYVTAFSTNQFETFSAYYTPDVKLDLNKDVQIVGSDNIIAFFKEQRKVMDENLRIDGIVLDETGCVIRADVTFTSLVDMDEGFFGMPPIKRGQGYNTPYLIWYSLTKDGKTKCLKGEKDFMDYVGNFNEDNFSGYSAYYSNDIFMNIASLSEKSFKGYMEWIKPMHAVLTETLALQKLAFDKDGKYIVADFHTKFRSKGVFETEHFAGKWGPIYGDKGPLVRMVVWYHLDPDGYIVQLEAISTLMEAAPPRALERSA